MDINETNKISFQLTEVLKKHMNFIGGIQQFFGVTMIIAGALTCLGIITAIIGIPQIIAGIKLFKSGSAIKLTTNGQKEQDMVASLENLYGFWKYTLISFIISIVFTAIYLVMIISYINSLSYY
ncbi:DUF5362 family protein [Gilliamella sp. B2838]|uniref:DUF5362 family protein n=1 Tax=Gilliamella sp. B2838 TaxID=2818020 RepID=UPI00226980FC|nr:DUF5362 family protein [Gilliamella sp. B2838]MCX8726949.1 hypothetical protein [Gilliamella sp. B2838]